MAYRSQSGWLALAMLLAASSLHAQAAPAATLPVIDDIRYTRAQQLVDLGHGRRLNLYCTGSGSPTVIFDAGLGDETSTWGRVQPAIARLTRTCSYDRAGIGFSDAATRPGTSENIVDDLHTLLGKAGIPGPYILVGHSYGGLNVLLFASRYRSEVAGLVGVDPANELQVEAARQAFPDFDKRVFAPFIAQRKTCIAQSVKGFESGSELYGKCVGKPDAAMSDAINAAHKAIYLKPPYQKAVTSELESVRGGVSEDQVRAAHRTFGAMPIIVLTRSPEADGKIPLGPNETQQSRDILHRNWTTMHDELAARSTAGKNRIIANTGHYIQLEQPQAVIDAIADVLTQVRAAERPTVRH